MSTSTRSATRPSAVVRLGRLSRDQRGMTTAEYAVGTVAACGFAGILYRLLSSDAVSGLLMDVLNRAFGMVG